jgi:ABC-type multidrug transport system fused ATPase/permease subunit
VIILRILLFVAGLAVVGRVLLSAILTFVLPRGVSDALTRFVFLRMRHVFIVLSKPARSYEDRDRIWALFAPVSLLTLPFVWAFLILLGFAAMFWEIGVDSWRNAFRISGSSLFTLGFAAPSTDAETAFTFLEAAIGLGLVAILIAYLPTIYAAWSRREALVTMLEVRAGSPPTPAELFSRFWSLERIDKLNELWTQWETWFVDVEESHTSLASLSLFRSTRPERSWVVAAGCVLDAASLQLGTLAIPRDPQAAITVRSGTQAFRRLCTLFRLPFAADPRYPADPITVTRGEFDEVYDQLAAAGLPMVEDREQAWLDFAGWRINYEDTLRALAGLTLPPSAPWSSDRATGFPYAGK